MNQIPTPPKLIQKKLDPVIVLESNSLVYSTTNNPIRAYFSILWKTASLVPRSY